MSKRWAGIARFGGVGDNLVAASVLRPLKALGYNVEVITSPTASGVYLNNPFVDKLSIQPDGSITGDWQQWFVSRSHEYDIFVNLSHSNEKRHALFKAETAFWWPQDYRRKLCAGSYLETVHDILGLPHVFGPLYFPTNEEKQRALKTRDEQIGPRYITWVIAGSRIDKVYPMAAMAICRIIKELDIPVMMVGGGGKQFEYAKQIEKDVLNTNSTTKGLHLALQPDNADPGGDQSWPLRRSLAQVLAADLVISPDTGPAWAAAFEPVPKIILVSHASAENITKHWVNTVTLHADQYRVPCWPCHRLHDDPSTCVQSKNATGAACMSDISVETIMKAAAYALKR